MATILFQVYNNHINEFDALYLGFEVEKNINFLKNANEVVIRNVSSIDIIFNFPMNNEQRITFHAKNNSFTRKELAHLIFNQYKYTYTKENKTSKTAGETFKEYSKRTGEDIDGPAWNRVPTEGKYEIGLWGLDDLWLNDMCFDKKENAYKLFIEC